MSELSLFDSTAVIAANMPKELFTEPDDDWAPIAFVEGEETVTFPMGEFMGDDRAKDILAHLLLPGLIKHSKAKTLVMIMSIWQSETSVKSLAKGGTYIPPSQCDDRTEHVMISEYTAEGVKRQAFAQIQRHEGKPPTLGEWQQMNEATGYSGRFVEPLIKALKEVAS